MAKIRTEAELAGAYVARFMDDPTGPADDAPARVTVASATSMLHCVTAATVAPLPVEWLWRHRLAYGQLGLLDGPPGVGKGTLLLEIMAALTLGTALPGGEASPKCDVVFASPEDSIAHTIRPRAEAAGVDLDRLHIVTGVGAPQDKDRGRPFQLPDDAPLIEDAVHRYGAKLVGIDPVNAHLPNTDTHRDNEVRDALGPLARLAVRTGACVCASRHLRKSASGSAINAGLGSIAYVGLARTVLLLLANPDVTTDRSARVLAVAKSNLGPIPPSLTFRLEEHGWVSRVVWTGESPLDADALLSAQLAEQNEPGQLDEAVEWLAGELRHGGRACKDLRLAAHEAGIAWRTVGRARRSLGVKFAPRGFGTGTEWVLPTIPSVPPVLSSVPAEGVARMAGGGTDAVRDAPPDSIHLCQGDPSVPFPQLGPDGGARVPAGLATPHGIASTQSPEETI